jgi:hypothetical protein
MFKEVQIQLEQEKWEGNGDLQYFHDNSLLVHHVLELVTDHCPV